MSEQPDYLAALRAIRDRFVSGHEHAWEPVDVWRPSSEGRPRHPMDRMATPITIVLIVCKGCRVPQTMELEGVWTIEQVRGESTQVLSRRNIGVIYIKGKVRDGRQDIPRGR